jgi:hypothetical protein
MTISGDGGDVVLVRGSADPPTTTRAGHPTHFCRTSSVPGVPTSRRLAELRAPEFGDLLSARSILVRALGAVEQHGTHLALNNDLVIAMAVAEAGV